MTGKREVTGPSLNEGCGTWARSCKMVPESRCEQCKMRMATRRYVTDKTLLVTDPSPLLCVQKTLKLRGL